MDSDRFDISLQVAKLAIADKDKTTKEARILTLSWLLNTSFKQQILAIFTTLSQDSYWRTR